MVGNIYLEKNLLLDRNFFIERISFYFIVTLFDYI